MIFLSLAMLMVQTADTPRDRCFDPQSEREKAICDYMNEFKKLEIKTVDAVAVGTHEEMLSLRPAARSCELMNRVDGIDDKRAFFEIVNASDISRKCIIEWIRMNKPHLELTSEKKKELGGYVE